MTCKTSFTAPYLQGLPVQDSRFMKVSSVCMGRLICCSEPHTVTGFTKLRFVHEAKAIFFIT